MIHLHCRIRDTSLVMDKLRIKYAPKLANAPLVLPDLMPDNQISDVLGSVNLETNLLELFCRGMLNPREAEFSLKVCIKYLGLIFHVDHYKTHFHSITHELLSISYLGCHSS